MFKFNSVPDVRSHLSTVTTGIGMFGFSIVVFFVFMTSVFIRVSDSTYWRLITTNFSRGAIPSLVTIVSFPHYASAL